MTILWGAIIYALAASASSYTTARGIKTGAREKNRGLAWIMGRVGVIPALLATKILGGFAFAYLGIYFEMGGWPLAALAVPLTYLAYRNWRILRAHEAKR